MDKHNPALIAGEFLASNAEFFAQAFSPLNSVFDSSGPMNIISEEAEMTVAIGVKQADDHGAMDVDCVLLDPDQESLRDCIDTLFAEEAPQN
ncbi:MAG: hypothetical protein H7A51_14380 [Akkermansiaceae bacterium]|nr:hypothetical protein [Akkermansiaceae bacterium]